MVKLKLLLTENVMAYLDSLAKMNFNETQNSYHQWQRNSAKKVTIVSYKTLSIKDKIESHIKIRKPKLKGCFDTSFWTSVDVPGVENGGIEFFGTKDAPQVVGEDGKLTPPAPPPGSGLPIPPEAITTQDTFIGQPGGTSFNSPDVAVPIIEKPVDTDLS